MREMAWAFLPNSSKLRNFFTAPLHQYTSHMKRKPIPLVRTLATRGSPGHGVEYWGHQGHGGKGWGHQGHWGDDWGRRAKTKTKGLNTRVFRWLTWLLWATTICLGELTWYGGKTTNLSFLTPGILQAARILWYWSMHSGWPPSMSTANVWLQAWEINDRINITLQESLDCNSVRPSFSIFCQSRDPTPSPQGTMPVSWYQTYKYSKYHSMTWVLPITGALGWKNVGLFIIGFGHWSLIFYSVHKNNDGVIQVSWTPSWPHRAPTPDFFSHPLELLIPKV